MYGKAIGMLGGEIFSYVEMKPGLPCSFAGAEDRTSLRLNQRRRKTLGLQTRASELHESVAWTV